MNPQPERPQVFISYARQDGEAFARDLRDRLSAAGIVLWRDREGMEGGRDWWLQITAAIDHVGFLVLVITEAALKSELVRREWRYARQQGVTVYPVQAASGIDFSTLPRWMRSAHFYDLDYEWSKFVSDLNTRPSRVRVPFMVDKLPEHFVERPEQFDRLLDQLLDRDRGDPVAITTALRGAGGFGKTALARALCHDEAIQDAFDDGILWVTLGEQPGDLTGRVGDLIYMLSGEKPSFAGLETAVTALTELLADREILIVIDDAWDAAHVHPFLQGGPRCARIITTRVADALPRSARRIDVDAMATNEAVSLLAHGLPTGHAAAMARLARRLGEWPLLLGLVNAALCERVLQNGQDMAAALSYVNRALDKDGLTSFDAQNPAHRHGAVKKTLEVSLDQLSPTARERVDELAVFPEDATIPLATLTALWQRTGGFDDFDTERLCERLARLSLVQVFDPTARFVRLHDVVRGFLVQRLGVRAVELQGTLLDACRPASGDWADLGADEPYWWGRLFEHLAAARRLPELLRTALDLRYLAAKAVARTSFSVEEDLREAERRCPDDSTLPDLRRSFAQGAHLLADCRSAEEATATLYGRFRHVPALAALAIAAAGRMRSPRLEPLHRLPDLPHRALVRTLGNHRGAMRACAISTDGALIATASSARQLILWDGHTGNEVRTLAGGETGSTIGYAVRALDFSGDGRRLASAAADRRLRIWDTTSGAVIAELVGHTDAVTDCALSADGSLLVSSSLDASVKLWDVATGALVHNFAREWFDGGSGWPRPINLQGHWSAVHSCAISADGTLVASASSDQTVIVWDAVNGWALRVLEGHRAAVNACAFSPDGKRLVSCGADRTIRVWDWATGESSAVTAHQAVTCCAFGADAQTIVTGSADGTVRLWSGDVDELLQSLHGHDDAVNDCAVSVEAGRIVSAADDGTARVWDLRTPPSAVDARGRGALGCAAMPKRRMLVTASQDGTLKLWDVVHNKSRRTWQAHEGEVRGCAVSADGRLLASAGADHTLAVWDAVSAECLHRFQGHRDWVSACAFGPGDAVVASVSGDRTLRLWDLRTRARRIALVAHQRRINGCAIGSDGKYVLTAADDGVVRRWPLDLDEALWEAWLATGRPLGAEEAEDRLKPLGIAAHAASVNQVVFSPGAEFFVSCASDGSLKAWDTATGTLRCTFQGHLESVSGCAVSADGSRIASVSVDGALKVWSATDGRCLSQIRHDGSLSECAWLDDDNLAAVGPMGVYLFACR